MVSIHFSPFLHGGIPIQPLSPTARELLTEKFHALLDGSDLVARNAAHGQALDDLETFFLIQGRAFIEGHL